MHSAVIIYLGYESAFGCLVRAFTYDRAYAIVFHIPVISSGSDAHATIIVVHNNKLALPYAETNRPGKC